MLKKKQQKYASGKVRSETGSHLIETDLILLIFMSNGSHLGQKKISIIYTLGATQNQNFWKLMTSQLFFSLEDFCTEKFLIYQLTVTKKGHYKI